MAECIFCKIINSEVSTTTVGESAHVLAFADVSPSADTHILIVPKKHIETFMDLTDTLEWDEMRQMAQQLVEKLNLSSGYKLVFNGGKYQHVPHVHWHLLGGNLHQEV